jgi:preprotein translocase subunit SecG
MFESRRKANAIHKTNRIIAMIFVIIALSLIFLGMTKTFLFYYVAFVFGIVALVFIASGGGTWSLGAEGEETVATHLSLLGYPYRVIHDVVLPGMTGNIDHIVLGPNGVFVIETKNNNGFISCNGDLWTQRKVGQRGTPYLGRIGCPSKQAKRYAIFLRSFIQDKLDRIIYVNCAVVFTNRRATLRVYNPTVPVLRPNELCRLIKLHQSDTILDEKELQKLEKAIRSYSRYN